MFSYPLEYCEFSSFKACQFFLEDLLNPLPSLYFYCNITGTGLHQLNNTFLNDRLWEKAEWWYIYQKNKNTSQWSTRLFNYNLSTPYPVPWAPKELYYSPSPCSLSSLNLPIHYSLSLTHSSFPHLTSNHTLPPNFYSSFSSKKYSFFQKSFLPYFSTDELWWPGFLSQ